MKIRAGYEISYECSQPTPMILTMSVHPARRADLITPDQMRLHPKVPVREYSDVFSNICQVIRAPAGLMTISSDFLIEDSGRPDAIAPPAAHHSLDNLPVETLVYLLGSRYCETDRLSDFAWAKFGNHPKGGAMVQAICDSCMTRSSSDMRMPARQGPLSIPLRRGGACAGTSLILPLRSAAA